MDLDRGIVGWNGQDDPEMPWNFSKFQKWSLLGQISAITFISPLASSIFSPGLSYMEEEFHKSDNLLSSFTVSVFILGIHTPSLPFPPSTIRSILSNPRLRCWAPSSRSCERDVGTTTCTHSRQRFFHCVADWCKQTNGAFDAFLADYFSVLLLLV